MNKQEKAEQYRLLAKITEEELEGEIFGDDGCWHNPTVEITLAYAISTNRKIRIKPFPNSEIADKNNTELPEETKADSPWRILFEKGESIQVRFKLKTRYISTKFPKEWTEWTEWTEWKDLTCWYQNNHFIYEYRFKPVIIKHDVNLGPEDFLGKCTWILVEGKSSSLVVNADRYVVKTVYSQYPYDFLRRNVKRLREGTTGQNSDDWIPCYKTVTKEL